MPCDGHSSRLHNRLTVFLWMLHKPKLSLKQLCPLISDHIVDNLYTVCFSIYTSIKDNVDRTLEKDLEDYSLPMSDHVQFHVLCVRNEVRVSSDSGHHFRQTPSPLSPYLPPGPRHCKNPPQKSENGPLFRTKAFMCYDI